MSSSKRLILFVLYLALTRVGLVCPPTLDLVLYQVLRVSEQ